MTSTDRVDAAAPGPVWTVAAVARRLGVSPSTLRSWSLRYGIGPDGHRAGRHRRYTAADVAELDTMRRLADEGLVLPAAAAIARSRRIAEPTGGRPGPDDLVLPAGTVTAGTVTAGTVQQLVQAARRLDPETASSILEACLAGCGVATTWDQLCRPAFHSLGTNGSAIGSCVDAELTLSWAVATSLRRRPSPPAAGGARRVLLACTPGEQHTLPLEALLAALVEHHVPVRMLGPSVPTSALLHATEQVRPAAVVVWAQRARTARPTPLRRLVTRADAVVVAGPGWHHVALPPTVTRADSLADALDAACRRSGTPD